MRPHSIQTARRPETSVRDLCSPRAWLSCSEPDYAECSRSTRDNCSATILSSPGCSMNEHMLSPGRPSPPPITIEGLEFLSICETCFDSSGTLESHEICM